MIAITIICGFLVPAALCYGTGHLYGRHSDWPAWMPRLVVSGQIFSAAFVVCLIFSLVVSGAIAGNISGIDTNYVMTHHTIFLVSDSLWQIGLAVVVGLVLCDMGYQHGSARRAEASDA